jgi:hypothetical protein
VAITEKKAIEQIFNGACNLETSAWQLKLAPPGHEYHRPDDIEKVAKSVAQVQSGLSALTRILRRVSRARMKVSRDVSIEIDGHRDARFNASISVK